MWVWSIKNHIQKYIKKIKKNNQMLTKGCEWGAKLRSTAVVQQTLHLRLCLHNKAMMMVVMVVMVVVMMMMMMMGMTMQTANIPSSSLPSQ